MTLDQDSEFNYEETRAVVDKLIVREHLSLSDSRRLEIFLTLMEAYEREHPLFDEGEKNLIAIFRYLMDQHGMNASDLGRLLGNRSLGSAILRGKRSLSKNNIQKLCERFHMSPELFV